MDITIENTQLNELQVHMLRLLKKTLPEKAFKELRRLTVKLLADELDQVVHDWEQEYNISEKEYKAQINTHFRTPYAQKDE